MQSIIFRPWGLLPWVINKLPLTKWNFLGCLSFEERCLAAFEALFAATLVDKLRFHAIQDPPSSYWQSLGTGLSERRRAFLRLGGRPSDLESHDLFERAELLVSSIKDFINVSNGNIIVDVSSFPKRFFLPILRLVIEAKEVRNLLVTYTVPAGYSNDPLAEDPEPWRHIPLFAPPFPEPKLQVVLVALGFETLGLPDLIEHDYHDVELRLLFPFPPGPPGFQRSWECVRKLEAGLPQQFREPVRVHALDISEAFDHMLSATDNGKRYSLLAPYGPKPISVAMGIFATLSNMPIYYTQPRAYNPNYSSGIKVIDNQPQVFAYCIRLEGRNLYELTCSPAQLP
jgi:hypothetical protein